MLVATLPGVGSHTTRRWYSQYQTLVLTVPDVGTPSGTASVGTGLLYYKLGWLTEVSLFLSRIRDFFILTWILREFENEPQAVSFRMFPVACDE